jgi:hypothetical protein
MFFFLLHVVTNYNLVCTVVQSITVIRFVTTSAKFAICTVLGLNGILVEEKIRTF